MYNQIYSQIACASTNPNFSSDLLAVQALGAGSEALLQLKDLFVVKNKQVVWHFISLG